MTATLNNGPYLGSLSDLQIGGPDAEQVGGMINSLRRWLAATESTARFRNARGRGDNVESRFWQQLADLGMTGACVPSTLGGTGLHAAIGALAAEPIGQALSPEPYIACSYLPATFLRELPKGSAVSDLLHGIADGSRRPVIAMKEKGMRGSAEGGELRITRFGDRLTLSGSRSFVYGTAWATDLLVIGELDGDHIAMALAPSSDRLSMKQVEMCDGSYAGELHFDNLEVSVDAIITSGDPCSQAIELAMAWARIAVSVELFGVQTALFGRTLEYLRTRTQFDVPLASFQALQHRCVDLYCGKELARFLIAETLHDAVSGSLDSARLQNMSSRCKARASSSAQAIAREAVQLHGAIGFSDENDVALYLNRTMLLSAWLGTADDHRRHLFEAAGAQAA